MQPAQTGSNPPRTEGRKRPLAHRQAAIGSGAGGYLERPVDAWHLQEKAVHPETIIRARSN